MTATSYEQMLSSLQTQLELQVDKPDETHEATLRALWLTAAGTPLSTAKALHHELPVLNAQQQQTLTELVAERLDGKPLAYITARQSFMDVEFVVGPGALIPRRETELLGTTALEILRQHQQTIPIKALDLCTGCGNLAIALALKHPGVRFLASDISAEAIALAKENVVLHGLQDDLALVVGDLFAPLANGDQHGQYDIITCNPPYISSARVPQMTPEIAGHEPSAAFDGGFGGMAVLRRLLAEAPQFLVPGGWLVFEVGAGQGEAVIKRLTAGSVYSKVAGICDRDGTVRVVKARV